MELLAHLQQRISLAKVSMQNQGNDSKPKQSKEKNKKFRSTTTFGKLEKLVHDFKFQKQNEIDKAIFFNHLLNHNIDFDCEKKPPRCHTELDNKYAKTDYFNS